MPLELRRLIADVVPVWLLLHELMKSVRDREFVIEAICRDGKRIAARGDFAEGRAACRTEATIVGVRGSWFVGGYRISAGNQCEPLAFDEHEGTGADLPATRAVAGAHHGW